MQVLAAGGAIRVDVAGRPRTKGSMKPVHVKLGAGRCKVSLTESGEYSLAWKSTMIRALRAAVRAERFAGAVVVDSFFRFERLCSTDLGLDWPTREKGEYAHGDLDKLSRNVWDALTQSGVILDDAYAVTGMHAKRWARTDLGESCGVLIKVRPADALDLQAILASEGAA